MRDSATPPQVLTARSLSGWRLPVVAGAMEAAAYLLMANLPWGESILFHWIFFGILVGALGGIAAAAVGRVAGSGWRVAPLPFLAWGMFLLPALWLMIEWLDSRYLGNFYGAPGSMVAAAISSLALGAGVLPFYGWIARRCTGRWARVLVFSGQKGALRVEVSAVALPLLASFVVFESLFVFLQVWGGEWIAVHLVEWERAPRIALGMASWFGWGATSVLAASLALRPWSGSRLATLRLAVTRK